MGLPCGYANSELFLTCFLSSIDFDNGLYYVSSCMIVVTMLFVDVLC